MEDFENEDLEDDDFDFDLYEGTGHHPEVGTTTVFCAACNFTYTLGWSSQPGGRESEPITCPDCKAPLGGYIETEWTLENRQVGDTGERGMMTNAYREMMETQKNPKA